MEAASELICRQLTTRERDERQAVRVIAMKETGIVTRERQLSRAFVQMADTLVADYDVVELLQQLVDHCVDILDASAAGLLLSDQRGGLQVLASSSEEIRLIELIQLHAEQGPCLAAYTTGRPVLVPDLAVDAERWPEFARESQKQGFRSVHALPLRLRTETIGAMGLFGTKTGMLPDNDLAAAQALADVATIGILHQRITTQSELLTEQLQTALNSRIVIEQAKGVLAERGSVDMDEAFQILRTFARQRRIRLVDLARQVVADSSTLAVVIKAGTAHRG